MNEVVKVGAIIAGSVMVLGVAMFGIETLGIKWNSHFQPKKEEVRRNVFEQTKSYNQAKVQELTKYRLEYMRAKDPIEKSAIASTIRIGFADYNTENLPLELQVFVDEIKYK